MANHSILLVTPISHTHYVVPPVGLGYLATALRRHEFKDVEILDSLKEKFGFSDLEAYIAGKRPVVVGFQVFSADFHNVQKSINIVKAIDPHIVVLVGGPHVSSTVMTVLHDMPQADFAFCGEGEKGLPLLMQRLLWGRDIPLEEIPVLIWRNDKGVQINDRFVPENLDELGFPAWDLMRPDTYPDNPQGAFYKKFPIAPISTSRGCPYRCTFCAAHVNMGRKLRLRSMPHVFQEMELLYQDYGVREFHIIDDMFNFYKDRVKEFCYGLKERGWDITYTFPNGIRLNQLDEETLSLMKETGAYAFTVGIESGSQRVLNHMKKGLTLELIEEKIDLINKVGLEPSGFFIIGYPTETKEDIEQTIQFAKRLKLKRAHFSNFLPLPGTDATERLFQNGEIERVDYSKLFYSKVPYAPKGITEDELKRLQRRAFLEFHLRPRILLKMLSEIKSLNHLRSIVKRAWDYLFMK